MKKIAAVIVTYNRKELLCECIEAVLAQKPFPAQKPVPAPEPVLTRKPLPAGKGIVPDILIIDNHPASPEMTGSCILTPAPIWAAQAGSSMGSGRALNWDTITCGLWTTTAFQGPARWRLS